MNLLALETSTEACSVAVWIDGAVRERFELAPRRHAELALPWAEQLLAEAGWTVQEGVLKNAEGAPFAPEIVLNQSGSAMRAGSEVQQIVDIYVEALRPLGIQPRVTVLDSAQYVERTNRFAFDMAWYERGLSLSPGNEQALYWGTASATQNGSKNWMGVASPAVDAMIDRMVNATTAGDYTAAVQALAAELGVASLVEMAIFIGVLVVATALGLVVRRRHGRGDLDRTDLGLDERAHRGRRPRRPARAPHLAGRGGKRAHRHGLGEVAGGRVVRLGRQARAG